MLGWVAGRVMTSDVSTPTVGVVVPAFNAERFVCDTMQSVFDQSLANWLMFVIDDGSCDATPKLVAEMAAGDIRVRPIHQTNAGASAARNTGISAASEAGMRYVSFLDSDDLLLPEALAMLVQTLEMRPDAVAVSGLAEYIDAEGKPVATGSHSSLQRHRLTFRPQTSGVTSASNRWAEAKRTFVGRSLVVEEDTTFDSLAIYGSIWPPATALCRLETVSAVGGFDATVRYMEDWDFFMRLARKGPIAFLDHQVAWYRRHDGNSGAYPLEVGTALGQWDMSYQLAVATIRHHAWTSKLNTPCERRVLARAHRRAACSLCKEELSSTLAAFRSRRLRAARSALAWCCYALRQLAIGHPTQPRAEVLQTLGRPHDGD
jgi:glycosyltransferase involved in cell wall biosynthesis